MTDKELIKQEIERRMDLYSIAEKDDSTFARMGELSSLMDFIDSLPEESGCEVNVTTKNEDLDEYYKKEFLPKEWFAKPGQRTLSQFNFFTAQHFAEWGRNHFEDKSEMVSEDLEEACDNYYDETWDEHGGIAMVVNNCHDIWFPSQATSDFFKAGAEWQKQKDQETIELAEDHAMLAGMTKEREEMMKGAVYGYVSLCHDYPHRRSLVAIADGLVNFEYAERVKIIIIKTK